MIGTDQVANGIWMGTVLLMLGLIPGLYRSIFSRTSDFSKLLALRIPVFHQRFHSPINERTEVPRWFGIAGAAVLLLTFAAYLF